MPAWVVWLLLAGALGVGEVFTLTLWLGLTAVAALVGAVVALLGAPVALQLLGFAVAEAGLLVLVRPLGSRLRQARPGETRFGIEALHGRSATVLERVDADGGRVRLAGEVWSARPCLTSSVIEPGAHVQVLRIEGATALVYEVEPP